MTITIAAIYEKGVLRPRQPLRLAEGTEVHVTISAAGIEPRCEAQQDAVDVSLDRLAALDANWDGYGAAKLDRDILTAARRFAKRLASAMTVRPLVVPISNGGLQFEWHHGSKILELEIEDPQTVHYLKWDPEKGTQEEDVFRIDDFERASDLIRWFEGTALNG